MQENLSFKSTLYFKIIYVFRINDRSHQGCLKIGDATLKTDKDIEDLKPNTSELNNAAKKRINSYTSTAGIIYELIHTELAVLESENSYKAFRDYKVHEVLKRSGIESKNFETIKRQNEWFITDLETVKKAIKAVKNGEIALNKSKITSKFNPVIFRPEQLDAIKKTISRYKINNKMLWNAKMRFGKTLTALQVAKDMSFKRTIIITHRPVVSEGWFEDFNKIFYDRDDFHFGSKNYGKNIKDLIRMNLNFVYFASIQDLRGSESIGGNYDKNHEIFNNNWDFVVVDEGHEGTKTELGKSVLDSIIKEENKEKTYLLVLSGTPFNLLVDFEKESIFTWDYIMEQESKALWAINNYGDSSPYEELPKLNIFTYHLDKALPVYIDLEDKAFNFREFFRVWTGDIKKDLARIPENSKIGDFIHEKDIKIFLDLISKKDQNSNYPFSTEEYRNYFRHSLWMVPGVKEAKSLSRLLKKHNIFGQFTIINVAGEGDEEIDTTNALNAVKKAITKKSNETYTITISCGRLTTGVTVPEWTAVLMLSGSYSTAASQYLQTIFRVQTPANINGKIKEECYVFDFAPDRTLRMVAESVQLSARAGEKNPLAEETLKKFLNYSPVIAVNESKMKEYKVSELLQELKKAYAERVAKNGFDDSKIYNDDLLNLNEVELSQFADLRKIVGETKQTNKPNNIEVNNQGFDEEENEKEKATRKKKELTEEEKKFLAEIKEKKKNRDTAISILRAISIRMPLLIYGFEKDISIDVTIDNFSDFVDDLSWKEFMPSGVTKEIFKKFSKYYDKDIFIAASRRIRYIAKNADDLDPLDRINKISNLLSTFRNPDKETVLTPWRVVNMHLGQTLGGYVFFDDNYKDTIELPRSININKITDTVFSDKSKILEINSKTGLYPLFAAYSIYQKSLDKLNKNEINDVNKIKLWDRIVAENIFIICKTPMAKQITKKTLVGYRTVKTNMHAFDDLIMQLKEKPEKFLEKTSSKIFWNQGDEGIMKFNAVIGNPPYQIKLNDNEDQQNVSSIYHLFMLNSLKLNPDYVSLIMPSRWMTGGRGLDDFRRIMLDQNSFLIFHDHLDSRDCFTNVDIKGGVSYFVSKPGYSGLCDYYLHSDEEIFYSKRKLDDLNIGLVIRDFRAIGIIKKIINSKNFRSFEEIAGSQTPFGLVTSFKNYTKNQTSINNMKIYGNQYEGYTSSKNILKNADLAYKYKVFLPKAIGDGIISTDKMKPIIPDNPSICTQTYIVYGDFETRQEAENLSSYMKTKFFHFLLGQLKNTQQLSPSMFKLVPIVDFKVGWTDSKLYKKFGITEDEIKLIDSIVWPKD
jgi:superfamily II DNA or RNA helicase